MGYIRIGDFWYPVEEIVVVSLFVICVIWALAWVFDSFNRPLPAEKTPEELDQEAVWYRAEKRRLEALTEYEMKQAELEDTRRFLNTRHKK